MTDRPMVDAPGGRLASYEAMSREQAIARLKVAEDALVLIGWSTTKLGEWAGAERADAAEQMWHIWAGMVLRRPIRQRLTASIDETRPTFTEATYRRVGAFTYLRERA